MLTKDDFIIRDSNCIHLTSRDIGGGACGGVSVLVRDGIPYSECKLNTTLQAKAVTISTSNTIIMCSLCLPPSENLNIDFIMSSDLPTSNLICYLWDLLVIAWLGVMIRIIVGEIELTILLRKTIFVYLMMVLIHICTHPQEH